MIDPYFLFFKFIIFKLFLYIYIYIYIKNFVWEDQRQKQCYIDHIAPRDVHSSILFIYRTGYTYGKEPKVFQKVFLCPFSTE